MIDNSYNQGFYYERDAILYYISPEGKVGYEMWDGYFSDILDGCGHEKIEQGGILFGYVTDTEWCDESPWKIRAVSLALEELKMFSTDKVPEAEFMFDKLREIQPKLVALLSHALEHGYDVYIEYN